MNTPIEQMLEAKVVAAVQALGVDGVQVYGSWGSPQEEETAAALTVTVSPRAYTRYTICEATFVVAIDLTVAIGADPTGARFSAAAAAVSEMLHLWNMNRQNEAKTALAVDGVLSIGGIRVTGGSAPMLDMQSGRRSASFLFDVTGFVSHSSNTNKNTQGE